LNDWGEVVAELGDDKRAAVIWRGAETIKYGSAAYNLAGYYAKLGNAKLAKELLLAARDAATLPPIDEVKDDPAFESLREIDWFQDFTR
jgi:hypothetical protein